MLVTLGSKAAWMHTQMCMHGGERDKKTSLLYGGGWNLIPLAVMCDMSHSHKPWGSLGDGSGWATGPERNYPKLFCRRIAKIAAEHCKVVPRTKESKEVNRVKIAAGIQPRQIRSDLIAEFKAGLLIVNLTTSR